MVQALQWVGEFIILYFRTLSCVLSAKSGIILKCHGVVSGDLCKLLAPAAGVRGSDGPAYSDRRSRGLVDGASQSVGVFFILYSCALPAKSGIILTCCGVVCGDLCKLLAPAAGVRGSDGPAYWDPRSRGLVDGASQSVGIFFILCSCVLSAKSGIILRCCGVVFAFGNLCKLLAPTAGVSWAHRSGGLVDGASASVCKLILVIRM